MKKLLPAPLPLKALPPMDKTDVKDKLFATLIHNGDQVHYRFTAKWPYAQVSPDILDLSIDEQRSVVRKAIDNMKPLWKAEKDARAAEFMAYVSSCLF
jgi:hypothetical protein